MTCNKTGRPVERQGKNYTLWSCERLQAFLVLFFGAMVLCLPLPHNDEVAHLYPWWAKRICLWNILVHELLFGCWLVLYGGRYLLRAFFAVGTPTRQAAIWLSVLAVWCGIISLSAPLPWQDLGRTFRLLLNAALLLAVVRWARQAGEEVLIALVLGFFTGTVINLLMSFAHPLVINGVMRLSGQNTPGVAMGIAIHLAAWLFSRSPRLWTKLWTLCTAGVFVCSTTISFSRIGWLAGGLGMLAWLVVLGRILVRSASLKGWLKLKWLAMPLLVVVGLLAVPTQQYFVNCSQWLLQLIDQKISYNGEGDQQRLAYFNGTLEIILQQPLGVGYSGFYEAIIKTEAYQNPHAATEVSSLEANPHATFLWYTTAGGILGGLLSLMLFLQLLNSLRVGLLAAFGKDGWAFFLCISPAFLLMGLTVPYLFNSIILIGPTAIAAGWGSVNSISQKPKLVVSDDCQLPTQIF